MSMSLRGSIFATTRGAMLYSSSYENRTLSEIRSISLTYQPGFSRPAKRMHHAKHRQPQYDNSLSKTNISRCIVWFPPLLRFCSMRRCLACASYGVVPMSALHVTSHVTTHRSCLLKYTDTYAMASTYSSELSHSTLYRLPSFSTDTSSSSSDMITFVSRRLCGCLMEVVISTLERDDSSEPGELPESSPLSSMSSSSSLDAYSSSSLSDWTKSSLS
ncbi:hypothetical protein HD554DRAFT_2138883 [Boletus coccyginus]|nr:hypothetical protein HD554DRAFT_2138883 [Boletus coccyginus]